MNKYPIKEIDFETFQIFGRSIWVSSFMLTISEFRRKSEMWKTSSMKWFILYKYNTNGAITLFVFGKPNCQIAFLSTECGSERGAFI